MTNLAQLSDLGLILGGDLVLLHERIAIASTSMPVPQTTSPPW